MIIDWLLNHPALLLLALPAVPAILGRIEKAAIRKLLSEGDDIDQSAIRDTLKVWVLWAEKKGARDGTAKFAAVDRIAARALPFLSAEQRKELIEKAVAELDQDANDALAEQQPANPGA